MSDTKHTPTRDRWGRSTEISPRPWMVEGRGIVADGITIANVFDVEDPDAAHIVRCVNGFDELTHALTEIAAPDPSRRGTERLRSLARSALRTVGVEVEGKYEAKPDAHEALVEALHELMADCREEVGQDFDEWPCAEQARAALALAKGE